MRASQKEMKANQEAMKAYPEKMEANPWEIWACFITLPGLSTL
jgi:hypothetical protein